MLIHFSNTWHIGLFLQDGNNIAGSIPTELGDAKSLMTVDLGK